MMRRRALLAAAGAALPISPHAQPAPRMVRDAAGRTASLPPRITRAFPAGPPASILLWSLAPDLLAGWTRAPRGAERDFLPPTAQALPEVGRLTGQAGDTANVEAVLARHTDLLIDYGLTTPRYADLADRLQARTGLPYLLLDGALPRIPETFRLLGQILDRPATAHAETAETLLAKASDAAEQLRHRGRPRVYYARGPRGLQTGLAGSINTEIIEFCGAENVAASQAGTGGLTEISPEQVVGWDPDWIITPDAGFASQAQIDPLWRSLRAVRAGRIALAPILPFGWVDAPPSVNRLFGLAWLPVLFGVHPAESLPGHISALSSLLYHHNPAPAQIAALLRAALPAPG